ncbi:MAG: efflux RND transporter periplasmic adaptor subunit [Acetobacteraceae bacterium]
MIGIGLAALLAAGIAWRLTHRARPTAHGGAGPALVEVATAATRSMPVYLNALGTVIPYDTVTVQPMITGPLQAVLFHQGQTVAAGQVLARIDPAPYRAALDQAEAKLAQDQAALDNAELQARQYAALVRQNYTSKQQAATAAATAAEDRAQVRQDRATIETDRINLGYTRITAPIAGRTGILNVDAGNIVGPTTAGGIVTINTIQPVAVQFSLPQQDLPAIQAALAAGPVPLLATAGGDPATAPVLDRGTLWVLDNTVAASTGTLTLKGRFPNPKLALWPGAYVNVRVRVRVIPDALTVPPVALQQGPDGAFVYLVRPGPKPTVIMRPVSIGYQDSTAVVITKGLQPGDRVVTEGTSRLHDGAAVKIVPATAARGKTAAGGR